MLDGKAVLLKDLKTKTVYNIFVKGILKSPTAQESICRKLNKEITNWEEIYTLTRKITIDSYSRIRLYKILNNILYVNKKNTTSSVSFMHFKAEMKTTYPIEYKIAMQNGMLHKHFSKWELLAPLL